MPKFHPALLKEYYLTHVNFLKNLEFSENTRPPIENIVFEGGGTRGVIYAGVIETLEAYQILPNVQRVAGSSAGAIAATLVAVGFTGAELTKAFTEEINFKDFMDHRSKWDPKFIKIQGFRLGISSFFNLFKRFGIYKGDAFKKTLGKLIKNKIERKLEEFIRTNYSPESPHAILSPEFIEKKLAEIRDQFYIQDFKYITFGQLHALKEAFPTLELKDLYLTGTNLTDASLKVFSFEHHSNMSILEAMRISMSFPLGFEPVYYQGHYYSDGGIANNYPMSIFDKEPFLSHGLNDAGANPCTLGFLVDTKEEIKKRWGILDQVPSSLSFINFISNVLSCIEYKMDIVKHKYALNSVQIRDKDIQGLDLEISPQQIQRGINAGKKYAQEYIQLYLGQDVLYQEKNYDDLYQKYFSMNKTQLLKSYDDLIESLLNIETLQIKLKKIIDQNLSQKLERLVMNFSPELVQEQEALFNHAQNLHESLAKILEDITAIQIRKANKELQQSSIIKKIQTLIQLLNNSRSEDRSWLNEEIIKLYKNFEHSQNELNEISQELQEHEKNVHNISTTLNTIDRKKNRIIYDLLFQIKTLNYIQEHEVLSDLARINEIYHEHFDILLDALEAKREKSDDPRINPTSEMSSIVSALDTATSSPKNLAFNHFLSLRKLTKKLKKESDADFIQYENAQDLTANATKFKQQGFGKKISDYDVATIKIKTKEKMHWKSYTRSEKASMILAHILVPSKEALANANKATKDILIVFPSTVSSGQSNFSSLQKNYSAHNKVFEENRERFLTQLIWAIRQIKSFSEPKDAKIQLTIFGEGIGGLDAQLMLIDILKEYESLETLRALTNIELILQDAPKVQERQAIEFSQTINKLKITHKHPALSIEHYKHKNYTKGLTASNYFGECDLANFTQENDLACRAHVLSPRGLPIKQFIKNKDSKEYDSFLNISQSHFKQQILQNVSSFIKNNKKMTNYVRKHFLSELKNIAYHGAKNGLLVPYSFLKIPYYTGRRLIAEIKSWFRSEQITPIPNWIAQPQRVEFESSYSIQDEAFDRFMRSTTLEQRLSRGEKPPVENLVLAGSGLNSLTYIGALNSLSKSGILKTIKRIAATSWGGFIAGLTAIGFHPSEITQVIEQLKLSKVYDKSLFFDPPFFKVREHLIGIGDLISLFKNKGLYKGEVFTHMMQSLIQNKLLENLKKMVWDQITPEMLALVSTQVLDPDKLNIFMDKYLAWEVKKILAKLHITNLGEITFGQLKQLSELYPQLQIKELYISATNLEQGGLTI
ncbi:MAG TPA: patatin-like phospholipase family protein, partial [Gammaproteobacteria bacterium]|nr:patatin-like phospholipase family protein [Gammaproteobacteria bacterium]